MIPIWILPSVSVKYIKKLGIASLNMIEVIDINKQNKMEARKVKKISRMQDSIGKVTISKFILQDNRHPNSMNMQN